MCHKLSTVKLMGSTDFFACCHDENIETLLIKSTRTILLDRQYSSDNNAHHNNYVFRVTCTVMQPNELGGDHME